MPGNTRHNLVESILSKIASSIGGIEKAWVCFHMGASKYPPNYNSSGGECILGLYIYYSN